MDQSRLDEIRARCEAAAKDLCKYLPPKQDMMDLIGAADGTPFGCGRYPVWVDPEPYAMEAGAKAIEDLLAEVGRASDESARLRAEVERLRAAYEAPPTSLTLDDLKQMEGEPVYIQYGDGKEGWDHIEDGLPIWLESDPDFINMTCSFDKDGHFGLHVLGWQAFRRRPEAARTALEGGQQ